MNLDSENLSLLAAQFFAPNYNYLWLRTMLEKGRTTDVPGSTLITSSSYGLNGIYERAWKNAVNCSMHSQDLYYDFLCARRVLQNNRNFKRCLIIVGYWNSCHDVSLSKVTRTVYISGVWYPLFHDAHNWDEVVETDPWAEFEGVTEQIRAGCEIAAKKKILEIGTYYFEAVPRPSPAYLKGLRWDQVPEEARRAIGAYRGDQHNALIQHKTSLAENKEIFREFVRFLYSHSVTPIVVVPPFTPEYNLGLLKETKDSLLEVLDSVPEFVHYVDFNETDGLFVPEDFTDPDHLSEAGARKMSAILADMFGQ